MVILISRSYMMIRPVIYYGKRHIWGWLNSVFNKVDPQRIQDVGPDRAAAEWLIRCGASVKWKDKNKWDNDYNNLPASNFKSYFIEEIDATDSCIMSQGFPHLKGLAYLKRIKLHKCYYLEDAALGMLYVTKDTLQNLEVTSCGNVTDSGILSLTKLINLRNLLLYDLPQVKNRKECMETLQKSLPACTIDFSAVED